MVEGTAHFVNAPSEALAEVLPNASGLGLFVMEKGAWTCAPDGAHASARGAANRP
jgi:hypothetical protein